MNEWIWVCIWIRIAVLSRFHKDKSRTHLYSHACPLIITTKQYPPYTYPAPTLSLAFHKSISSSELSYTLLDSISAQLLFPCDPQFSLHHNILLSFLDPYMDHAPSTSYYCIYNSYFYLSLYFDCFSFINLLYPSLYYLVFL